MIGDIVNPAALHWYEVGRGKTEKCEPWGLERQHDGESGNCHCGLSKALAFSGDRERKLLPACFYGWVDGWVETELYSLVSQNERFRVKLAFGERLESFCNSLNYPTH